MKLNGGNGDNEMNTDVTEEMVDKFIISFTRLYPDRVLPARKYIKTVLAHYLKILREKPQDLEAGGMALAEETNLT